MFTVEHWFPYVTRRVPVIDTQIEEKSPIEVALSEMESQVVELAEIVNAKAPDIKKLQLRFVYLLFHDSCVVNFSFFQNNIPY